MLGSKKGIRDIRRAFGDMRNSTAEARIEWTRDPEEKLELMLAQRDRDLEQALAHQSRAKGVFNGPAELRAAKACEARAESWNRKIAKLQESMAEGPKEMPAEPPAPKPEKSHTVAIILSILLGALGVDRLYLGHNAMAFAKLLSQFIIVGVAWWIIDAVLVATKGTSGLKAVNWKQS